jgi:hypothetical protein
MAGKENIVRSEFARGPENLRGKIDRAFPSSARAVRVSEEGWGSPDFRSSDSGGSLVATYFDAAPSGKLDGLRLELAFTVEPPFRVCVKTASVAVVYERRPFK